MCLVSVLGTEWTKQSQGLQQYQQYNPPTREEFEALKQEILILRQTLQSAKKLDRAMGQPDCEMEEKVALIKRVAEAVGVDLGDVFDAR